MGTMCIVCCVPSQEIIPFVWDHWDIICTKRSKSSGWRNNLSTKLVRLDVNCSKLRLYFVGIYVVIISIFIVLSHFSQQRPEFSVRRNKSLENLAWWIRCVEDTLIPRLIYPSIHTQDLSTIGPRRYESKTVSTKGSGKMKRKAIDNGQIAPAPKKTRG